MPQGYKSISTMPKFQRRLLQQQLGQLLGKSTDISQSPLYQQGSSYLQNLLSGSPEAFKSFEAPFMRQFQEEILPSIAERFSGLGAGAQSSSAFQNALGQAGAGLSEKLAALRSGLQFQASGQGLNYAQQPLSNLLGFSQLGLGTQARGYVPRQQPFWQQLLMGLSSGAGQAAGSALGGLF